MPTYSYRCTECGHAFDIQQAFTDATLTECPSCGGALRKIFSPVGITFNGSGFYRTDSRAASGKGGDKGGAGSDAGAAKKEKSGGETTASTPSKSEGGGTSTPAKTSTPGTSGGTRKAASSNATS